MLPLILAAIIWGTITVSVGIIYQLGESNALSIGFWRLLFSLPLLLGLMHYRLGRKAWQIPRKDMPILALIGVAMAGYQITLFAAIPLVGVTVAVLITLCVPPVLVALVSIPLFKERITGRLVAVLVLALLGTFLLTSSGDGGGGGSSQRWLGILLAFGAACCYSSIVLAGRWLRGSYTPVHSLALSFSFATVLLLPFALLTGLDVSYDWRGWSLLLYLGIVTTGIGYILFMQGLQRVSATVGSVITLLEPLVASLLAALLLRETITWLMGVGALLLIVAVLLLSQDRK